MKNNTFMPLREAAVRAARSSTERLMVLSPTTRALHGDDNPPLTWLTWPPLAINVLNTCVKTSTILSGDVLETFVSQVR